MSDAASIELPPWAKVGERRRAHIARVTALLMEWAGAMSVAPDETRAWRDAGLWHTIGCGTWARPGRALYMADFLDPGRRFMREDRAALAARVPSEFDVVLRQVVRIRLEWSLREGNQLFPETVGLWNAVR
jgi:hypothetical protein